MQKNVWIAVALVAVVVVLIPGLSPLRAAASEKSPAGTWKIKSVQVNGKHEKGMGGVTEGTVWKFKKSGKLSIAGEDVWDWSYDKEDKELKLERDGILWGKHTMKMSVRFADKVMKLSLIMFGYNYEFLLTPDD